MLGKMRQARDEFGIAFMGLKRFAVTRTGEIGAGLVKKKFQDVMTKNVLNTEGTVGCKVELNFRLRK
jgi:hypothetical protein